MKILRLISISLIILTMALAACSQQSGSWEAIGNLPNALLPPQGTFDMALSPDGTPYIAYASPTGGNPEILVVRYNNGTWENVGTGNISQNAGTSVLPDITFSADGTPYVVWADNSSGFVQIYVRFYDGFNWSEIGTSASGNGVSNSPGASLWPTITLDNDGFPIVAWSDDAQDGATNILVRRWDGSQWDHIGANSGAAAERGISDTSGVATRPFLTISDAGTPIIAWQDSSGPGIEIYAMQWDGFAWVEVSPGSNSGTGLSSKSTIGSDNLGPFLLPGHGDQLYLSWAATSVVGGEGIQSIYAIAFDGSSWNEVSGGSASDNGISGSTFDLSPEIALDGQGNLYITWASISENSASVAVKQLVDNEWVDVGEEPPFGVPDKVPATGETPLPQIVADDDGTLFIAWLVQAGNAIEIHRYEP